MRKMIADERTGLRPLNGETVWTGIFDGDLCAIRLENGCVIDAGSGPNYRTRDGREFAEVLALTGAQPDSGEIIGYVEIAP